MQNFTVLKRTKVHSLNGAVILIEVQEKEIRSNLVSVHVSHLVAEHQCDFEGRTVAELE